MFSAWAPGIKSQREWSEWSRNQRDFDLAQKPDVSFIKPMVRRRLSSLAKMIFATSHQLLDSDQTPMPLVFASRYGEMEKTVQLLTNLSKDEGLSPTSFGLSVHNSLVGMYGMIQKWTESSTAIGAGRRSLSAGLIEAFSQSKSCESPVLYFYYDEPLPRVYDSYSEEVQIPLCIGMIVNASDSNMDTTVSWVRRNPEIAPLEFIKLLIDNND